MTIPAEGIMLWFVYTEVYEWVHEEAIWRASPYRIIVIQANLE